MLVSQDFVLVLIAIWIPPVIQGLKLHQSPIFDQIDPDSIRGFLQELSSEPHIAGSDRDIALAQWVEERFREFGVNVTQFDRYNVLLSYPDKENPNVIQLLDELDEVKFTSRHREEVLRPEDDHPNFVDAFLAYTPPGEVQGDLVYVNYGREEDLDIVEGFGIDLIGKIAIARYGKGHRGNKVRSCQERGAIGVILFSDPFDVTNGSTAPEDVYPNTQFLPGSGIQRGTTKVGVSGDPLSSGWPSVDNAYRDSLEDSSGLPSIPAQPIGYDDAKILLEKLGGPPAPPDWFGGIDIPYFIGGEFTQPYDKWRVKLSTHNVFDDTRENLDVIGVIPGSDEPDRYVILSNHRDAWGFGAVDPSSATSVLLEMARVFGNETKTGWRPKRTLVFANWAAEEYGLLGSTEWVFDKMPKLKERTVAVINLDQAVYGSYLYSRASPSLANYPIEAIKLFPAPANDSISYYDYMKMMDGGKEPSSRLIGSGSDHDPFVFQAGIPVVYPGFVSDTNEYPNIFANPTYHTGFETFYSVDSILDPGFKYHKLLAQIASWMMLELSENDMLSFDLLGLSSLMNDTLNEFDSDGTSANLEANNATLEYLRNAVQSFDNTIVNFQESLNNNSNIEQNSLYRRMINDQIMNLERIFIADQGLPGRDDARHLIYSPSKYNRYSAAAFPGIRDLLSELNQLSDPALIEAKWKEIRRHVSDLMIAVRQADCFLQPFELF